MSSRGSVQKQRSKYARIVKPSSSWRACIFCILRERQAPIDIDIQKKAHKTVSMLPTHDNDSASARARERTHATAKARCERMSMWWLCNVRYVGWCAMQWCIPMRASASAFGMCQVHNESVDCVRMSYSRRIVRNNNNSTICFNVATTHRVHVSNFWWRCVVCVFAVHRCDQSAMQPWWSVRFNCTSVFDTLVGVCDHTACVQRSKVASQQRHRNALENFWNGIVIKCYDYYLMFSSFVAIEIIIIIGGIPVILNQMFLCWLTSALCFMCARNTCNKLRLRA